MDSCPACDQPLASGSYPCEACGAPEPSICTGCGILVAAEQTRCGTCHTSYPATPVRARPQPRGGYWVGVRATFSCSACRFKAPLNHFPAGDGVVCARCGIEQRDDRGRWKRLVDVAETAGDLGVPFPGGRFPDPDFDVKRPNALGGLGHSASWARDRELSASPGNPLCPSCSSPWVVTSAANARVEVACQGCGATRSYQAPKKFRRLGALVGVLADEHEEGAPEAALVERDGVSVLSCPSCSGPLSGEPDTHGIIRCEYCQVQCRISSETRRRLGHGDTEPLTFWLYFEGPCHERERQREAEAERARLEGARLARERRIAEQWEQKNEARRAAEQEARAQERTDDEVPAPRAQRSPARSILLAVVLPGALLLAGGAYFFASGGGPSTPPSPSAPRPRAQVLEDFSFSMTPAQTAALLGAPAADDVQVAFTEPAVFAAMHLGRDGTGEGHSLELRGGARLDLAATRDRLSELAPNQLDVDPGNMAELSVNGSLVRVRGVDGHPSTAVVELSTSVPGPRGAETADALLAAVRYAAMGGARPTTAQLRILNGPPLTDAAGLDPTTTTPGAAAAFRAIFPEGRCGTRSGASSAGTSDAPAMMECSVDVDHPRFEKLTMAWSNDRRGHLQEVTLDARRHHARPSAAIEDCVTAALGPGEPHVVDFASGATEPQWTLGPHGDRAALVHAGARFQLLVRDGAGAEVLPDWSDRYRSIIEGLARCPR